MSDRQKQKSVGLVETRTAKIALPPGGFVLESGETLPELAVAYETYGTLAADNDNVIFVCHALSGDAHVAGRHDPPESTPPWWDEMVGPGKGIDTEHYFVVCANILGGCKGTTGPSSIDPRTGKPYGSTFPNITVGDIVTVHRLLLEHLGIDRVAAVIGGSFGGMQALEWAIRYPEIVGRCICIASASSLSAQALAFDIVGRNLIVSDPYWHGGDYYGSSSSPENGLAQARKIGHITYLSPEMMTKKFGREKNIQSSVESNEQDVGAGSRYTFQVESYLDHQGKKFVARFDANSYLHITRAMDEYDLVERYGSLEKAFEPIKAKMLIVALSSDWLFPPEQSVEIANALLRAGKRVSYCRLHAPHGHDAFLVDIEHLAEVLRAFLPWVRESALSETVGGERHDSDGKAQGGCVAGSAALVLRREFDIIRDMIRPGTRVLDVGCGNGDLLTMLARSRHISGIGIDIDLQHVIDVIDKGHDIFQADIDGGLAMIPDGAYDYAVLSETLPVVRKPRFALREMLRVAHECIVAFPNFGKWSHRLHLCLRGRMPKGETLPFEWYDTPNIHSFTLNDFVELCSRDDIRIIDLVCIPAGVLSKALIRTRFCNLGADRVLVKIARASAPPRANGVDAGIKMPARARDVLCRKCGCD